MHTYATLGMLALAGAALAAPAPNWGGGRGGNAHIVYETAVVTVIVGPDGQPINAAAPTPAPEQPAPPAPAQPTSQAGYYVPPSPVPEPSPEPSPEPVPSPSPTPEPQSETPPSSDSGYMGVVNTWRQKLGLPDLAQDATLEANALKTCNDGNGEMKHELNPGTFGQVLAPGQPDEFERVFVGGWLCEKPDMPGMNGVCAEFSAGWAYDGQTGHAEILTNTGYKKIGCANAKGIWGCDVA